MADYPVLDGNGNVIIPAAWQDAGKELYPVKNAVGTTVVANAWGDAWKPQYPVYGGDGTLLISVEQGGGVSPNAPVNTIAPVVTGSAVVGSLLTCSTGTWTNSPTSYTYQWRKNGVNIGGETTNTYTTVVGDIAAAVDCVVRATNADGFGTKDSNDITVTSVAVPVNSIAPVVSGATVVGSVLSCTTGTWSGSPSSYAYQWRKAGVNIGGATADTYTSVSGDIGAAIDCVVTASNAGGAGTPVDSNDITVTAVPAYAWANLAALFSGGAVDGIMIDLTDITTLFQDANGNVPVSANGHAIGLALDQHKWGGLTLAAYRASQPELVSNGNFDSGVTGWTGATWDASNKRMIVSVSGTSGSYNIASLPVTTVIGRWYEYSIDYQGSVTGSPQVSVRAGTATNMSNLVPEVRVDITGPKTYRFFFKATTTTSYIMTVIATVGGSVSAAFDSVSIKEIDGHHATSTGGARPTWASATGDVAFDGSADFLTTDYKCGASVNALAVSARFGTALGWCAGAAQPTGATVYLICGMPAGTFKITGYSGEISGSTVGLSAVNNTSATALVDRGSTQSQLAVNGVVEDTKTNAGGMPSSQVFIIGAYNNNGTPAGYFTGGVKRVVAVQARAQDTMTAADIHANIIAA